MEVSAITIYVPVRSDSMGHVVKEVSKSPKLEKNIFYLMVIYKHYDIKLGICEKCFKVIMIYTINIKYS